MAQLNQAQNNTRICAIGLDIGGTKIAGGLVEFPAGHVLLKRVIPTQPQRGGETVLAETVILAQELLAEAKQLGLEIAGIGLGVAELVDPAGNVTSGHTIPWRGLPVQATFARLAPAVVESDVRAAALAEAKFGAGQPFKHFVYLTVGTGISHCLVQAGQPYSGARGNALVLASGPLTITCPECGAKVKWVLEEIAAGPALVTRYHKSLALVDGLESKVHFGLQAASQITRGEDVLAATHAGDSRAMHVVKTAGEALGVGLAWLVNVLDPEAVIVGGGLGLAGGVYRDSFIASTREHIWAEAARDLPILPAALGPDAGLIGAAAAVIRQRDEETKRPRS
ncbi:MAG: glucokinase [Chloroflexota bacterium]|nr:MAG: glucokinase [Chloroflexota bacterium]